MTKLRVCPAFSLALNESTDESDTAQLMVSVRYFNEGVSKDFLCLTDPIEGHNDSAGRLQCAVEIRRRKLLDVGKFGFSVYRRRAQHAWSSSWIRCVVPSRNRKAESDIIPLHNSPASIVRESRLWSPGYDENCRREREPYPRTFSQPQEVPKSFGCT